MAYTLHYDQDRERRASTHGSLDAAVEHAARGEDAGRLYAVSISAPDGAVVMHGDALRIAIAARVYEWDARRE
ncbi:hypothetical protein [Azospirillum sp.]|uniref:hypothetical protein n=1 Tax=Azospirillum sp. TaxID=34012 RepID=UPI003D75DE58